MQNILDNPAFQYGALGLSFILSLALIRGFFQLMTQSREQEQTLFRHHMDRERAFTEQFLACIDRNSAALEKVEQGLQKIQLRLARNDSDLDY